MRVLVVNTGSSSLKLQVLDAAGQGPDALGPVRHVSDWDGEDLSPVAALLDEAGEVDAVGHRVVHGGPDFRDPVLVDDAVVERLRALIPLAPLHQERALAGIAATRKALPDVPQVACFDTSFHAPLPLAAATYALPAEWRERWPLRRFGFHGLSHAYAARRAAELASASPRSPGEHTTAEPPPAGTGHTGVEDAIAGGPHAGGAADEDAGGKRAGDAGARDGAADTRRTIDGSTDTRRTIDGSTDTRRTIDGSADTRRTIDGSADTRRTIDGSADAGRAVDGGAGDGGASDGLRVVTCHLGSGASLCASQGGRSVDTTMGFTPLEGLVMGTRAGSVDPGLVLWLVTEAGLSADQVQDGLEHRSGLAGLADTSDMREVLDRRHAGDPAARLAFDVYVHVLAREIAAMTASLGGLDVLAFTGGVGEHAPEVREAAAARLPHLGLAVDPTRNSTAPSGADTDITALHAPARTVVVAAREDLEIAHQTRAALA